MKDLLHSNSIILLSFYPTSSFHMKLIHVKQIHSRGWLQSKEVAGARQICCLFSTAVPRNVWSQNVMTCHVYNHWHAFMILYIIWDRGWRNPTYFRTSLYCMICSCQWIQRDFLRWIRHRLLRRWDEMASDGLRCQNMAEFKWQNMRRIERCGAKVKDAKASLFQLSAD